MYERRCRLCSPSTKIHSNRIVLVIDYTVSTVQLAGNIAVRKLVYRHVLFGARSDRSDSVYVILFAFYWYDAFVVLQCLFVRPDVWQAIGAY